MRMTPEGVALIKEFEGFSSVPYLDAGGKKTIGYGHVIKDDEGHLLLGVTRKEAEELLAKDISHAESVVRNLVKVQVSNFQFSSLVSLVYNIGAGNFERSTLLKKLNAGDHSAVPPQMLRWTKVKKSVSRGLLRRRMAEIALWKKEKSDEQVERVCDKNEEASSDEAGGWQGIRS